MKKKLGRPAGTKTKKTWSRKKKESSIEQPSSQSVSIIQAHQLTQVALQMGDYVGRLCKLEEAILAMCTSFDKLVANHNQTMGIMQGKINTLEALVTKPERKTASQPIGGGIVADFPNRVNKIEEELN